MDEILEVASNVDESSQIKMKYFGSNTFHEKVLNYDPRSNLEKISLIEKRDHPMLIEGDEFDIVMAPRIPPSQL